MIDDDDGKVRRNLVFTSSAILISAWLGVPGSVLLGSLSQNLVETPPWKFTTLGFALLGYLTYRYRFTAEGTGLSRSFEQSVSAIAHAVMFEEAKRLIEKFRSTDVLPTELAFMQSAIDIETKAKKDGMAAHFYIDNLTPIGCTKAKVVIRQTLSQDGSLVKMIPDTHGQINWSFVWAAKCCFKCHFFGRIYSNLGPQLMAPLLLAISAEVVLFSRLVGHFRPL